jgi:hypothetical protein
MSTRYPEDDLELKEAVRDETSYENTEDELPESQLDGIIERSKGRLQLETGVADGAWYSDRGLGFALGAYACMRAKAAVENISLSSYSLGDEQVSFTNTDPDSSQQLQQWAEDVNVGLDASSLDQPQGPTPTNTSGYIGEDWTHDPYDDQDDIHRDH